MKRAFITGATGQDASYLIELLLAKGYEVWGLIRRSSTLNRQRIDPIYNYHKENHLHMIYGDMTDMTSLIDALTISKPDEVYNLAAQSHVGISYEIPSYTAQATGFGVLTLLEAIRILKLKCKIYQASTSELYDGKIENKLIDETTEFNPQSPYGAAKLYAHNICRIYREAYGMFISCGILFNHESPRRGENFVSRKITLGVNLIKQNKLKYLELGNINTYRDWGYAPEYVEAMWLMLQQKKPNDYIIATGKTHNIKEFLDLAFRQVGINDFRKYIKINKQYFRPNEVNYLWGNPEKAEKELKWKAKTDFSHLVKLMVKADEYYLKTNKYNDYGKLFKK